MRGCLNEYRGLLGELRILLWVASLLGNLTK